MIIDRMSDFDWSDLDGRLLRLLLAIVDAGSITGAAQTLGVTQSAVSHLLDKLRAIVGDPLFVKSGRGIVATARAEALAARARELLLELERFAASGEFDPAKWRTTFVIAANDLPRDALLPALFSRLRERAPGVTLGVISANLPTADIMQKQLFEDRQWVFYDPERRRPPRSLAEYLAADHLTVVLEPHRPLALDTHFEERGILRRFVVTVPSFAAVPAFLRDSDLIATAPGLLRFGLLQGLASAPPPIPCPPLPMYMIWSRRDHSDPGHRWLREQVEAVARLAAAARAK
jgi:DNA-binding transcriptional LysR family regulator